MKKKRILFRYRQTKKTYKGILDSLLFIHLLFNFSKKNVDCNSNFLGGEGEIGKVVHRFATRRVSSDVCHPCL